MKEHFCGEMISLQGHCQSPGTVLSGLSHVDTFSPTTCVHHCPRDKPRGCFNRNARAADKWRATAGQTQLEVPVPKLSYLEWPLLMAKERGRQQPSSGPHSLFHSEVVQRARTGTKLTKERRETLTEFLLPAVNGTKVYRWFDRQWGTSLSRLALRKKGAMGGHQGHEESPRLSSWMASVGGERAYVHSVAGVKSILVVGVGEQADVFAIRGHLEQRRAAGTKAYWQSDIA
ncbi:hypothetical protein D9C73_014804 [Collichthys lucidus]|uniref:Uncharacterized protein n=1 Tax=Collichthys lucidus TaxID=240159 RepID=A0A4V6XYS9_COLLU|nr:hypothetical protein D9C73_014804 [Collichthys lucidus]